jgi:hypothetical protein
MRTTPIRQSSPSNDDVIGPKLGRRRSRESSRSTYADPARRLAVSPSVERQVAGHDSRRRVNQVDATSRRQPSVSVVDGHPGPQSSSRRRAPMKSIKHGERLTLSTEELALRWGLHPESLKRAVRNGTSPVRPIIPGAGRWVFSIAAVEQAERATVAS